MVRAESYELRARAVILRTIMEANEELHEAAHEARTREDKRIGLTMAVIAVLLAISTMLGHRTHTESVLLQTRATDQWAFYQAKNIRAHMYEANSEMAGALSVAGVSGRAETGKLASDLKSRSEKQRTDAENIRREAEKLEAETQATERKAGHYDLAEIFFEIGIVLCSISLLSGSPLFWRLSFLSSIAGILIGLRGAWLH
jgi:Domain of unknown function (DUF4337)